MNISPPSGLGLLEGITLKDLEGLLDENPFLRGYLQGYLAEMHLLRILASTPGVDSCRKVPDTQEGHGDIEVFFKGTRIVLESKCISSHGLRFEPLFECWSGRVVNKRTSCKEVVGTFGVTHSTHYTDAYFDGLAMCTFSLEGKWDFWFLEKALVPRVELGSNVLKTSFRVHPYETPGLTGDISLFLERIHRLKSTHE
jgi:hypothetical protein